MKMLIAYFLLSSSVWAQVDISLKLSEIAPRLKSSNGEIYEGASRVYNAKQRIKFARASLLPKLNIWRLATVLVDWRSAADILTQDLVPFLVPANWQRVKQTKILSQATEEGFHGLTKNVIFQTKLQYLQLQQDFYQYTLQKEFLTQIDKMLQDLKGQTALRSEVAGWYRELSLTQASMQSDLVNLVQLIWEERQLLSLSLALETDKIILPQAADGINSYVVSSSDKQSLDPVLTSCEIKELDRLLQAAPLIKKEIRWNVLGVSEISRGMGVSVFDNIPIQDGLGFASASSVKIHKKQIESLKVHRAGVVRIIQRQLQTIEKKQSSLAESRQLVEEKIYWQDQVLQNMRMGLALGVDVTPVELIEAQQQKVLLEIEKSSLAFYDKVEQEKLMRMYALGDYQF